MKGRTTFIAIAFLCLSAAHAPSVIAGKSVADIFRHEGGYDFRKTRWGMTPDEVVKSEGADFRHNFTTGPDGSPNENGFIEYAADINGCGVTTSYNFHTNKLVMVTVRLEDENASKKGQMENLLAIRREIVAGNGQPSLDSTSGAAGGALMSSQWRTDRSYIFLTLLETNDNKYAFTVLYAEKNNFDRQSADAP